MKKALKAAILRVDAWHERHKIRWHRSENFDGIDYAQDLLGRAMVIRLQEPGLSPRDELLDVLYAAQRALDTERRWRLNEQAKRDAQYGHLRRYAGWRPDQKH